MVPQPGVAQASGNGHVHGHGHGHSYRHGHHDGSTAVVTESAGTGERKSAGNVGKESGMESGESGMSCVDCMIHLALKTEKIVTKGFFFGRWFFFWTLVFF